MYAPIINKIIEIFTEEKEILSSLLSISEEKKGFIIGGDVIKLDSLLERETELSGQLSALEEDRMALTNGLAQKLEYRDKSLTLEKIAELTKDPVVKSKLLKIRSEFSQMLKKQKKYNRTNQELLLRKKNYINVMLGALLQEQPLDATYDTAGYVGNRYQSTGLFDQCI